MVIDNSATFTNGSTDDIVGLSLNTITFTNNGSSGPVVIALGQNLTVTTAITQASSATTTIDAINDDGSAKTLTIGGPVTVTSIGGLSIGNTGDTLALGSNTLTFTDNGATNNIVVINADITGSGAAVVYNGPATDYQLSGNNTYSGTTHVMATDLAIDNTGTSNIYGSSAITVENAGSIDLRSASSATISNAITVVGITSGSPVTSLNFASSGTNTVLTVPNITLTGETRFGNENQANGLTINLAGINSNGFCVEYIGSGSTSDGPANGFSNGPAGCVVTAAVKTPGTPNTGFALIKNNPIASMAIILAAAGGVALVARQTSKRATHRR